MLSRVFEPEIVKKQILDNKLEYGNVIVINKAEKTRLIVSMTEKRASKDAHK